MTGTETHQGAAVGAAVNGQTGGSGHIDHDDPSPLTQPPARGVSPFQAAGRHIPLLASLAIVGALIGGGAGYAIKPTYSADTTLTVGRSTATANSVPGYAAALESLAGSYARIATSERVTELAAQQLRRKSLGVEVKSTQIAESSLFKITAEGADPELTRNAANVTANALIKYLSTADTDPTELLSEFEKAQRELSAANSKVRSFQNGRGTSSQLSAALARQAAARLRAQAIEQQYPQARLNRGQVAAEILTPAASAVSDRAARVRLYGVIGLVAGGLLALGIATIRSNRPSRV